MRPGNNSRRPRGRPNRKHNVSPRSQAFDSHGPDVRIRGNAPQIYEKYLNLARDAASSGDRIASESYFQFAEHYFRIMNDTTDPQRGGQPPPSGRPEPSRGAQERPSGDQEQPLADQEQPHVEWPGDGGGGNGAVAKTVPATEQVAPEETAPEETAPPRQESKPRQRSRRRPANGSSEAAAKVDAKPEPVAEDAKAAKTDAGDEESVTPVK